MISGYDNINIMKIVFFGTPEFAVPTLESLSKEMEILFVVTQPDKKVGRKQILTPPPIKISAQSLGLKIIQPRNKKELRENLKNIKADFFVVLAFGMILEKDILNIPKHGCINIHASLLPKYRGASPIQETLLNGDKSTGVSIMKMEEKLDQGPVYLLQRIEIEDLDDLETLSKKLQTLSAKIAPPVLVDIAEGTLSPLAQIESKATYCKKIEKKDGEINWDLDAEKIHNMIRAYNPWPSAHTKFKDKEIKIFEAKLEKKEENTKRGKFFIESGVLKISAKNGNILPEKLQIEGKNSMSDKEFLNGYKAQIESQKSA
ncbi:methionyl-tRNA formyltransferase [Candidatus Peregrinibacteria bacterium CG_4_10_14_0_2_um_filter_38_24]|nr:MAG: methionyl-tRNA formyltransferase [Candidatus Peregrinibacteria bacterium CG_4_10_14_0_2_um_filter_38_24]PJC38608.1 MAG: methionyl-tRNA formyltransferase [Candidatus Peregrinibacteria bacterium CG_4_9_14_0_2_um_filter_38_9]